MSSIAMEVENPEARADKPKIVIPRVKILFRPKWSPRAPPIRINAPRATRLALTTHWIPLRAVLKRLWMAGRATGMAEPARNDEPLARMVADKIHLPLPDFSVQRSCPDTVAVFVIASWMDNSPDYIFAIPKILPSLSLNHAPVKPCIFAMLFTVLIPMAGMSYSSNFTTLALRALTSPSTSLTVN